MRKTVILVIIVALFAAAATYSITRRPAPACSAAEEGCSHGDQGEGDICEEPESPQIDVTTEFAVAGDSWDIVAAAGKVGPNANKVVKVGPRISGKVVRVHANVGDTVRSGQVLATMSSVELAEARAAYRRAAAGVNAAESAYNRQVQLARLGAFSKRPVEEARAEHISAQGELSQAKSELEQNRSELVRAESELAQCALRLERARELYKDQIISRQDLESAEGEYRRDGADVEAVKSKIRQTEAKIQQAQARVGIAKTYLSREEKVLDGNLLASKELQAAKAELTAAQIELRAAADTIRVLGASPDGAGDMVAVTSPISGRIVERVVNFGEMVEPSSALFTVMNLSEVWVEAGVYEKDLSRIRKGQVAQIRVNAYPDRVFSGKVTHIGDTLDPQSRTARVRCVVSNSNGLLKPEMFATVDLITAKRQGAVLISREAVLDEAGKKIVFVSCTHCEEDIEAGGSACGTYDKRQVETGPAQGNRVEVLSGINPGEEVVTTGAFQLKTALGSGKLEAGCTDH